MLNPQDLTLIVNNTTQTNEQTTVGCFFLTNKGLDPRSRIET